MKSLMRLEFPRLFAFVALLAGWTLLGACDDDPKPKGPGVENAHGDWKRVGSATPERRDLDVLLVMDTSLGMGEINDLISDYIAYFAGTLATLPGGAPNLHFGVTTNDLGTGPYEIPGCDPQSISGGRLFKGFDNNCVSPVNQTYLIDVEPHGCTVLKTATPGSPTTCTSHDCTQANCEPPAGDPSGFPEPAGLTLQIAENGCPRCRNLGSSTIESTLQCMVNQGTSGCGMEQPLEAMRLALTDPSGANEGFLRPDADLAILLISDEDDCSASDTELFNPDGAVDSELGSLSAFRCTEFGVVCDEPWVRPMIEDNLIYHNCRPREAGDPDSLLYPMDRYTAALDGIKPWDRLIVTGLASPTDGTIEVVEAFSGIGEPTLKPLDRGNPAVRLQAFVQQFHPLPVAGEWPFNSTANYTYFQELSALAYGYVARFADAMSQQTCVNQAVFGCPDPSFAAGGEKTTPLPDDLARVCAPECEVVLTDEASVPGESATAIPMCDPAYAAGHPQLIDPSLPVPVCWHLVHDDFCLGSMGALRPKTDAAPLSGARIVISLRNAAAAGAAWDFRCRRLAARESTCDDGVDNDQDGMIDHDDPDCG
ncbi:MAG: hypothetical protein CVU65_15355 [Deltaproteobacteria bacterium HGW-Deltaproteobacteria-22]|jgi:hypothetical protein|nr:MAG: hypothetical protein CVU65_15355 [Deltaproteobacteria bacterium HGW-Deltaproteobacteria-22]